MNLQDALALARSFKGADIYFSIQSKKTTHSWTWNKAAIMTAILHRALFSTRIRRMPRLRGGVCSTVRQPTK
jgi:hypothetical protein